MMFLQFALCRGDEHGKHMKQAYRRYDFSEITCKTVVALGMCKVCKCTGPPHPIYRAKEAPHLSCCA